MAAPGILVVVSSIKDNNFSADEYQRWTQQHFRDVEDFPGFEAIYRYRDLDHEESTSWMNILYLDDLRVLQSQAFEDVPRFRDLQRREGNIFDAVEADMRACEFVGDFETRKKSNARKPYLVAEYFADEPAARFREKHLPAMKQHMGGTCWSTSLYKITGDRLPPRFRPDGSSDDARFLALHEFQDAELPRPLDRSPTAGADNRNGGAPGAECVRRKRYGLVHMEPTFDCRTDAEKRLAVLMRDERDMTANGKAVSSAAVSSAAADVDAAFVDICVTVRSLNLYGIFVEHVHQLLKRSPQAKKRLELALVVLSRLLDLPPDYTYNDNTVYPSVQGTFEYARALSSRIANTAGLDCCDTIADSEHRPRSIGTRRASQTASANDLPPRLLPGPDDVSVPSSTWLERGAVFGLCNRILLGMDQRDIEGLENSIVYPSDRPSEPATVRSARYAFMCYERALGNDHWVLPKDEDLQEALAEAESRASEHHHLA